MLNARAVYGFGVSSAPAPPAIAPALPAFAPASRGVTMRNRSTHTSMEPAAALGAVAPGAACSAGRPAAWEATEAAKQATPAADAAAPASEADAARKAADEAW